MRFDLEKELEFLYFLMLHLGKLAYHRFQGKPLVVHTEADGTNVTDLDTLIYEKIVEKCEIFRPDWKVCSKEGREIPPADKVFVVDPTGGTDDLIIGQSRTPRTSFAMISIGICVKGMLLGGAVAAPFLKGRMAIFKGGHHIEAWREHEECRINTEARRGLVLVANRDDATNRRIQHGLRRQGLTPLAVDGTVFRACSFMDPSFLREWRNDLPKQPIVGMIGNGRLRNFAAVVPMAESIDAVVTTLDGKRVDWHNDNGCVMANNQDTHQKLLAAINE